MTIDNQTPMKVVSSANEPFLSWLSMHVYSSGRRSWIRQNRTRCSRTKRIASVVGLTTGDSIFFSSFGPRPFEWILVMWKEHLIDSQTDARQWDCHEQGSLTYSKTHVGGVLLYWAELVFEFAVKMTDRAKAFTLVFPHHQKLSYPHT